jgi:hypothetical protein
LGRVDFCQSLTQVDEAVADHPSQMAAMAIEWLRRIYVSPGVFVVVALGA